MKRNNRLILGIAGMLVAGATPLLADTVTYNFGSVSSGTAPAGSPPWVQATFTDIGANTVQLNLNAGNLTGSEFLSRLYFNLDPALTASSLVFSESGSTGSFTDPTVSAGNNSFKAGPDGKFDVLLGFATAGDASTRFSSGDSLTFTITGISGLSADSFNQLSTCAGGSGQYASAAHIQSIAPDDLSGWVNPTSTILANADRQSAVPDGSQTVVLLGIALLAMEGLRRKMQLRLSPR